MGRRTGAAVKTDLVFLTGDHPSFLGSKFLRARQLCAIAQKFLDGLGVKARASSKPKTASDAVVVLNKSFLAVASPEQVVALQARGNAVLADFVDRPADGYMCRVVDGFLASSYAQERSLREAFPDKPTFLVLHHADLRIPLGCADNAAARFGYFGKAYNALHLDGLASDGLCDPFDAGQFDAPDWMSRLPDYSAHYAVRARHAFDGFKPFTKGAVAAKCGAVVLAERDEETVLSLGADYPFLLSSTAYEDVRDAIVQMKEGHGGPEWGAARAAMLDLRQRTKPARIAEGLAEAFTAFR